METKSIKEHNADPHCGGFWDKSEKPFKLSTVQKPLFETLEECEVCAKAGGPCYACFSDAPEIATQVLP